jgi:hypothetical protein
MAQPTAVSGGRNLNEETLFKKFVILPQGGSPVPCDSYCHLTKKCRTNDKSAWLTEIVFLALNIQNNIKSLFVQKFIILEYLGSIVKLMK